MTKQYSNSPVGRALAIGPFKRYVLGYVAGFHYANTEVLLTKTGAWSDSPHARSKERDTHIWPTMEQAMIVARKVDSPTQAAYVRIYTYETPNEENAKGLTLLGDHTGTTIEYVRPEANPDMEVIK